MRKGRPRSMGNPPSSQILGALIAFPPTCPASRRSVCRLVSPKKDFPLAYRSLDVISQIMRLSLQPLHSSGTGRGATDVPPFMHNDHLPTRNIKRLSDLVCFWHE